MEMTGEQLIPLRQQRVWAALNDPGILKACIPCCESIEKVSDTEYKVVMTAAIGPVKAKFNGKLLLADLNPPHSYSMAFQGSGGAAGFGKGGAQVSLLPEGRAQRHRNRRGRPASVWPSPSGSRIGATLKEFNLRWSRRVLGQNAEVLLISDGLDRDAGVDLSQSMERLHKSCRKLIWLNPLLRFDGFEPKATGVRLMLPHVDAFLPAHNVESLIDYARALEITWRAVGRSIVMI